jgi:death-on-curing protein
MERINLADFLVIAELHTGIDAHQLARIDRVVQLAESALAAPFAGYGDHELYPGFADRAAIYASRIARNHPLPDGNKRTASGPRLGRLRSPGDPCSELLLRPCTT